MNAHAVDKLMVKLRMKDTTIALLSTSVKEVTKELAAYKTRAENAEAALAKARGSARPESEWHEDYGPVVWWTWEDGKWLGEPSYIGGPNDSDWSGYHTHWTPHPEFPPKPGAIRSARDVVE